MSHSVNAIVWGILFKLITHMCHVPTVHILWYISAILCRELHYNISILQQHQLYGWIDSSKELKTTSRFHSSPWWFILIFPQFCEVPRYTIRVNCCGKSNITENCAHFNSQFSQLSQHSVAVYVGDLCNNVSKTTTHHINLYGYISPSV